MAQPVLPHHGARFQIERLSALDTSAEYSVKIFVEDGFYAREVTLSTETKDVVWREQESAEEPGQPMAEWMKTHAEALMRTFRKDAARKGVWGRRIRRWKDAPSQPS